MTLTSRLVIRRLSIFNRDNNAFHRFYSYNLIVSIIFFSAIGRIFFRSFHVLLLSQNMNFVRSMGFIWPCLWDCCSFFFLCVVPPNNSISNRVFCKSCDFARVTQKKIHSSEFTTLFLLQKLATEESSSAGIEIVALWRNNQRWLTNFTDL